MSAIANLSYYMEVGGLNTPFPSSSSTQPLPSLVADHIRFTCHFRSPPVLPIQEDDQLYPLRCEACLYLYDVLLHDHEEAIAEAARAFGNLSRDPQVADGDDVPS